MKNEILDRFKNISTQTCILTAPLFIDVTVEGKSTRKLIPKGAVVQVFREHEKLTLRKGSVVWVGGVCSYNEPDVADVTHHVAEILTIQPHAVLPFEVAPSNAEGYEVTYATKWQEFYLYGKKLVKEQRKA